MPDQFDTEYFFDMEIAFCSNCCMVQLIEQPERTRMFHENYAFYSSSSKHMALHFEKFSQDVIERYNPSFVIEIGSNDGITLKHFAKLGIRHLGIEPSINVADMARKSGVNTTCCFFDDLVADEILKIHGQADVILASNVMAHIQSIHSVMDGVQKLLKPNGVLIFEDPYMGDILKNTSYDQIYDEHAFYFSLNSVLYLVRQHGMDIIDAQHQDTHGGSMRYTIAHQGKYVKTQRVTDGLFKEYVMGMENPFTYDKFRLDVALSRRDFIELLAKVKLEGGNIVGYAATAKSATITNFCGLTSDVIDYICDTTPIKQGKFSPGAHIPIKPYEEFLNNYPTHALLFAWNHTREIMEKETGYKGKWIVYVPEVKVL